MNLSSSGEGSAVLIRAVQPLDCSVDIMRTLRLRSARSQTTKLDVLNLCNGPAKLCMAMDIDKARHNKLDLVTSDEMWIEDGDVIKDADILLSKRVGLSKLAGDSADWLLRFYVKDNLYVSCLNKKIVLRKLRTQVS